MTTNSEKPSESRELSRNQYIVRYGVLGWGVTTAVLFTIANAMEHGWDDFFFHLVPALILFPLGGVLFGRIMWGWQQRQLAKQMCCAPSDTVKGK